MVKAIINISEDTNRVFNVVKAKYGLKDKSAAIDVVAKHYEEAILEPELRPQYVDKALKISRQAPLKVGEAAALRKRYE